MKLSTYIQPDSQSLLKENFDEYIVGTKSLSRFGLWSDDDLVSFLSSSSQKFTLEWDVWQTEREFDQAIASFEKLPLSKITAVRAQDPGVIEYLKQEKPNLKIHLDLQHSFHNIESIKTFCHYLGEQVERVLLSQELPLSKVLEVQENLNVPVELLGLGRIALFYSPRKLLAPHYFDSDDKIEQQFHSKEFIEAMANSEETAHKGFPVLENQHGTFMFAVKDLCLLDQIEKLKEIPFLRLDLRFLKEPNLTKDIVALARNEKGGDFESFKNQYPNEIMRGFFNVNKTDILFKKLKNKHIVREDEGFVGKILELNKDHYLILDIKKNWSKLKEGQELKGQSPEGKEKTFLLKSLKSLKGQKLNSVESKRLVMIDYKSGLGPGSTIYLS